uniref:Synaptotagmin-10-like n=1 Tax=Saccoglossus kowalevskii TaxID=10224 RepID=A0ABM0GMA2_SACKO|nr:PREDICTED: synaptotagmin-10-like [Saccoglossus kowalevskii]
MEEDLPGYLIATYIILSVVLILLVVGIIYCLVKRNRKLKWLGHQSLDDESITESLKKASPRRKTPSFRISSKSGDKTPPELLTPGGGGTGEPKEFVIPGTPTTPVSVNSFTVEQPQPTLSPRQSRRKSMTASLDLREIDPSSKMYSASGPQSRQASTESSGSHGGIGMMNFSLKYNQEMNLLTVRLIEARELQPRDFSGTSDPYCKIAVLPCVTKTMQSRVHRKTLDPEFKESFVFEVPEHELHMQTVRIELYDFDQYSRDECVGLVILPLTNIDLTEKLEMWKEIRHVEERHEVRTKGPFVGDLMFSLAYLPSAERLTVVALKARNLRAVDDRKMTSDPYVKVSIFYAGKRLKKKKTSTKHHTVNPVFNEAMVFSVGQEFLKHLYLEFHIMHENRIGQNEVLGRVLLGPDSDGEELAHWNEMTVSSKPIARWHSLIP